MLSGKELGLAIEQAINKKISSGAIKTKAEIARHFKIKPPSIHDWIKKGSISKDKLPELWKYFSDVVGPEHWGLQEFPTQDQQSIPLQESSHCDNPIYDAYKLATAERRAIVDFLLSINSTEPSWVDSDVRAYVSTMDLKVQRWLQESKSTNKSPTAKKTGT
ncbi:hypothetical protein [Mixta mediterraneensis]|uniref:DNA-binding transcriptional repressor RacR n=1 Tax=Mixta mediterraneensis TaxID=2758443 RepID=UPI001876B15F|nr:hypothetical protein [Mixta mediterraneensis]MBE5252955.1 hypothetical protein [Mixta mediterraneensis]